MEKLISGTRRRQIIGELRHQLRYASYEDRERIRQELSFWEHRG
ncbi:MAG: hypothetical protein ACFCVD_23300 [Nodosilinea sp.]